MRYDDRGSTLWFGTRDAPAPSDGVPAGTEVPVTVGVQRRDGAKDDTGKDLKLLYRVNGGTTEIADVQWLWNASGGNYYRAVLPPFRVGEVVEYTFSHLTDGKPPPFDEVRQFAITCRIQGIANPLTAKSGPGLSARSSIASAGASVAPSAPEPANPAPKRSPGPGVHPSLAVGPGHGLEQPIEDQHPASQPVVPGEIDARKAAAIAAPSYPAKPSVAFTAVDVPPGAGLAGAIEQAGDSSLFNVTGTVASPDRVGVGGLRVQIVDKNVGQDFTVAETVTDDRGRFQLQFSGTYLSKHRKQHLDLQARVFVGKTFLAASDVRYNASVREILDVQLPANAVSLPSEHETLTGALATHYSGRLGELIESDDRQDITYLANKTGWDARAVALAALADRFSLNGKETVNGASGARIAPAFYYALFRAGLPANEDTLYHAAAGTLEGVWKKAVDQGVIPNASAEQIPELVERFQALSAQKLLTAPALVGASSFKEMLVVSGLNDGQRAKFAQLYAENRTDMPAFWNAIGEAFGQHTSNRLQIDGKLGFLTINNATLMQKARATAGEKGLSDPVQLAQAGYHRSEPWSKLLTKEVPIPPEIPGDTPETKRANYARYLAAQVRLGYPTAAVAQMIKCGELPLTGAAKGVSDEVYGFLTEHQGKFEIGMQPVQQYIARNKLQVASEIVTQVKRLQRVYQITPSDQALRGLMKRGIDAAYHVVRYEKDLFVRMFAEDLGGAESAVQTYDRSFQVHNAVLNIAISYLTAKNGIALGAQPQMGAQQSSDIAGRILQPAPKGPTAENAADVIAYPTLESLFGSMDFCACDHCRSILSPAAYLVDLLLFIDIDPSQNEIDGSKHNPQTILLERRPDIQHLPLTCENTNTALPYIDVVNETLEYYIANKLSLRDYAGHDADGSVSEDLLASPQFVIDSAYATLSNERFPTPLPFHQPLESLRRYFTKFEVPLPLAMERLLRTTDELERGANPYGWRDILMEEVGLSRSEYEILTDSAVVPLWRMYGFSNGTSDTDVINELSNAKQFAHRVGITYDDLISVLITRFINPKSDLIPKLERLGVNFATLEEFKNNVLTDAQFDALLAKLAVPPDPAKYGGDPNASKNDYKAIRSWVTANYDHIMGLIVLTDTSAEEEPCRFDTLEFRHAKPMASLEDTSTRLGSTEFIRLLRFIRSWKKLGWTIEQTDAAICALYREDRTLLDESDINDVLKLNTGFLTLLPRLGIVRRVMKELNLTVKRDLLPLLACWSSINTTGANSLYALMFLAPSLLQQDHGAQTATIESGLSPGDVLTTTINGVPIPYSMVSGDAIETIASNIANAINATSTTDPTTGLPLNSRIFASSRAGVITIQAGFTLMCSAAGATGSYVAASQTPLSQTGTIAGTPSVGDLLNTTINSVPIPYMVAAGDTAATIAANIASAINNTTTPDPYSGMPLNSLVAASYGAGVVTLIAVNSGAPLTLDCALAHPNGMGSYEVSMGFGGVEEILIPGFAPNRVLTTTVNGIAIPYTVVVGDNPSTIAANIAAAVNAKTALDPSTNLPLNTIVSAQATSRHAWIPRPHSISYVEFRALPGNPTGKFTLAASLWAGAYTAGRPVSPFADDGYGNYLKDTSQTLFGHESTLCAAFNLTGADFALIIATLGFDSTTRLTLANISAIYRRGWLARKLRLSVHEFLLLTQLTGLDPFASPDPTNPAIEHIIELTQTFKARSFKSVVALYLIWNQDLNGKSAPNPVQIAEFARTLRGDFAGINDQFAVIDDPNGDVARARMTLVYGQETSDAFFALLDDTLAVDVPYIHSAPALESAITAADPRIAYDDFRHRLSHKGIVTAKAQSDLKNTPSVSHSFQDAVDSLFARSEDTKGSFFARNWELKVAYDRALALDSTLVLDVDYTQAGATLQASITAIDNRISYDSINHRLLCAGVLTTARRDMILKGVVGNTSGFQAAVDALFALSQKSRGGVVLAALQPELARRRKRQQALQRLSAAAGVDLGFVQTILDAGSVPYPLHAMGDQSRPALDDVLALETPGLAAQFFFRDSATGNVDLSLLAVANLAYASGSSNPLPNPGSAISGIWSGQVEAPETGFYNLVIQADSEATVVLTLDGQTRAMTQNGNVWRNTDPLERRAGVLSKIELKVEKVKGAMTLKWETPKRAREVIPSRYLYPPTVLAPFSDAYVRFLKAASLATGLGLTANELAHFVTYEDYRINAQGKTDTNGDGWLNALPNSDNLLLTNPADAAIARNLNASLLRPLEALLDFARIKAEISPGDESLLTALKDPTRATQRRDSLLFTITRWNQTGVNDVLAHFSRSITGLGHFDLFRRVHGAFTLIQKMGVSAKALIQATTNEPMGNAVRVLQASLRARYEATSWRDVVRPINDEMRSLQRDALVAFILHQMRSNPETAHIDTPDKLFEYFLMDVQMDPCMQTSRIRHALSSVQLFIERCFMNLEPRVSPAAINAKQWAWMKRYRVWEANRKVYLFPENWLEPELRDDKSPFFKEIESELLQSDITEDSATTAMVNYLTKLEEVAKLEPCGIYHLPDGFRTPEINHVIARTAGAHRKYHYRRYEGSSWTPWEQIKLDIEDNPVTPVVWKDRLLIFWLRILMQAPANTPHAPTDTNFANLDPSKLINSQPPTVSVQAVLCWSEFFNGKWQPTKTSDINRPIWVGDFNPDPNGSNPFERSRLKLSVRGDYDDTLFLHLGKHGEPARTFHFYNTHSLPVDINREPHEYDEVLWMNHYIYYWYREDYRFLDSNVGFPASFAITYYNKYDTTNFQVGWDLTVPYTVLRPKNAYEVIEPLHDMQDPFHAPFFFADSRHIFYVTTVSTVLPTPGFFGYGARPEQTFTSTPKIPPLVIRPEPLIPSKDRIKGRIGGLKPGVIDPTLTERFITEDAYIRQGIGTTAMVSYGGRQIGPSGVVTKIQAGM